MKDVEITRTFEAPRELVYRAWTEPALFMRWWGPREFTCPAARMDVRIGWAYHAAMRAPDGRDFWSKGLYVEVDPGRKLVMTDSFADAKGNTVHGSYYGMSRDFPMELLVTVGFDEERGETRLHLRHSGTDGMTNVERANMEEGWEQSLDKLEEVLREEGRRFQRKAA